MICRLIASHEPPGESVRTYIWEGPDACTW
jgi:hypothetical protein